MANANSMYQESIRAFLKPVVGYLDDETVSEIMINGPEDVWIEQKGKVFKTDKKFTDEGLLGAARNMAQFVGRLLNEERPRLDARLPDGSRIHIVIAPIARKGTTISIRKFFKDKLKPSDLVRFGSLTPQMVRIIEAAVQIKLNMVVSGGTGSGKTTLLNVLATLVPNDERILTIEDSAELQMNQEHIVPFESRPPDKFGKGEVTMGHLLQSALRLRPDRIVVGEVRGAEAFDLVQAMNTGHGGSMATVHANTPTDTLRRIESLCLMSPVELPMVAVRAMVASAINFVTCCERYQDGSRKTHALAEVLPLSEKGDYRTQDLYLFTPVTKDEDGKILGYHSPTGVLPTFYAKARAYGFGDLTPEFFDPATYGVPPPPMIHGHGEAFHVKWAPSLEHRNEGHPDPPEMAERYREYEQFLKDEAKKKKAAAAAAGGAAPAKPAAAPPPEVARGKAQVQVPAAAAARPAARPASDDDKTPPPTRNPLPPEHEPSVSVSPSLMEDGATGEHTELKQPLRQGQPGRPQQGGAPVRTVPGRPIPPKR
jgi:pilus assembly protein CpaF